VETDVERLADHCDALVLVTDWQAFQGLDFQRLARLMINPVLIDGRNFLDRDRLEKVGFQYVGIGH
jgi:UDPglucose 6-dehydrogenase